MKIRELKKLPVNLFIFTYSPDKGVNTSKVVEFGTLGDAQFILFNGTSHYISIDAAMEVSERMKIPEYLCDHHDIDVAFDRSGKIITHEHNKSGKMVALGFCSDERLDEAKLAFQNEVKDFIVQNVLFLRRVIDKHQKHLAEL